MKAIHVAAITVALLTLSSCMPYSPLFPKQGEEAVIPAKRYADMVQGRSHFASPQGQAAIPAVSSPVAPLSPEAKARYQFVGGGSDGQIAAQVRKSSPHEMRAQMQDTVTNLGQPIDQGYAVYSSSQVFTRPYTGPLQLGEPGVSASLWRSAGASTHLFRDHRAFQAMDILTIVISEQVEGRNQANTIANKQSSFLAGIANFFNFEADAEASNPGLDTESLVSAELESELNTQGETIRRGALQGKIAAVVVEVLPSGVMRVEGERIITVSEEEQIMVISGLVRPRDVNSRNEVDSSAIANLRIDYFGRGVLGELQSIGWLGSLLNSIFPF